MLALGVWTLNLLPRATVWLRLPNHPLAFWTQAALELIVAPAGQLVKLDQATKMLSKGRYTCVAVEIDLATPLVPGSDMLCENSAAPFWQSFEYEHIHLFCRQCGRVGHRPINCPSPKLRPSPLMTASPSSEATPSKNVDVEMASATEETTTLGADDDKPPGIVDLCLSTLATF